MSAGRGRSWRPEKNRRARGARRQQIISVATILTLLVAGVVYLLWPAPVPPLHFVSVLETDVRQDSAGMVVVPNPAAGHNAAEFRRLVDRLHEKNPALVTAPAAPITLADVRNGLSINPGEKLMLYCAVDVRLIPGDSSGQPKIELIPGRKGAPGVPLTEFLDSLKRLKAGQIVLLLEPGQRQPGLTNGILADDLIPMIEHELKSAAVPSLTAICACAAGQRSWEYPAAAAAAAGSLENPDSSAVLSSGTPTFSGTAFGHFAAEAFLQGQTDTADQLFDYVQSRVGDWVRQEVGETQTVMLLDGSSSALTAELLARASVPSIAEFRTAEPSTSGTTAADGTSAAGSGPETPQDRPVKAGDATSTEKSPQQKFDVLLEQRDQIAAAGLIPVIFPVEWNRLQSAFLGAEECLRNQQTTEFAELHDRSIIPELRILKDRTDRLLSADSRETLANWLSPELPSSAVTDEDRAAFRRVLDESSRQGDTPPVLPAELRDQGKARQVFVSLFMRELDDLTRKLVALSPEERLSRIRTHVRFLNQLDQTGWPVEDFPHQFAAMRAVFAKGDPAWHVDALSSVVRLVQLRMQALSFAAGTLEDGAPLRRSSWQQSRQQLAEVLSTLTSAERWLAVGRPGMQLAEDRLKLAEEQLQQTKLLLESRNILATIADAQWHEILWLIQFLASQQETIGLPPEELAATVRMAAAVAEGRDPRADFPIGQLDSVDFRREHLDAMFALTRDLRKEPAQESDSGRLSLLRRYAEERANRKVSADERRRLLQIPMLTGRKQLINALLEPGMDRSTSGTSGLSATGVWMSFWSIRLLEAAAGSASDGSAFDASVIWTQWKRFVESLVAGEQAVTARERTLLGQMIRQAWESAFISRMEQDKSDRFTSLPDVVPLIADDLQQRLQASGDTLYSEIARQLSAQRLVAGSYTMSLQESAVEPDSDRVVRVQMKLSGIRRLYVQGSGIRVLNPGVELERDWQRLDTGDRSDGTLELVLQTVQAPEAPLPILLAAVNEQNAPVAVETLTVYPSSRTDWDLEFIRPDGRLMTLFFAGVSDGIPRRRLTLLPRTIDPLTGMDSPSALKFQIRRTRGTASKAAVQLYNLRDGSPIWSAPRIVEFAATTGVGQLSLKEPVAAAGAASAATATPDTGIDLSEGFRVEITPEDVLQKITSKIDVVIVFSEPEQFVSRPHPAYNHSTNSLEIRLDRAQIDDPTVLVPSKLPVSIYFSPALRQYLRPGSVTALPDLSRDGLTLRYEFRGDIERADLSGGMEFAVSVAGIPNPWRWRLTGADPVLIGDGDQRSVRVDLRLADETKIQPLAEAPELLIGKGWQDALLHADVFLYGGRFDDRQWQLELGLRNRDTDRSTPIAGEPLKVRRRYAETVRVSSAEGGAWLFSTRTVPWSGGSVNLSQYGLPDGRYELTAGLRQADDSRTVADTAAAFIVDGTAPVISDSDISIPARVFVDEVLTGSLRVADPESGIASVQVGLDPDMLRSILLTGDTRRPSGKFEINPSQGYPFLEQRETDHAREVKLTILVRNHAGLEAKFSKSVVFVRRGKPAAKMEEKLPPGTLEVTFNSATTYVVSITGGPAGTAETKTGARVVLFPDLAPGQYTVEWKTEQQGRNKGSSSATVSSGRKTTVVGKK